MERTLGWLADWLAAARPCWVRWLLVSGLEEARAVAKGLADGVPVEALPALLGVLQEGGRDGQMAELDLRAVGLFGELERGDGVVALWPARVSPVHRDPLVCRLQVVVERDYTRMRSESNAVPSQQPEVRLNRQQLSRCWDGYQFATNEQGSRLLTS